MSRQFSKIAAAGLLLVGSAASAFAGSVTQPGETVGVAAGTPLPQGFYLVDTTDWGCRNTKPEGTCVGVTIPVYAWSTPWTFLGARVQLLAATPAVDVGVNDTFYKAGWYNPLTSAQLAWDLGNNWGFSYLIGEYWDVNSGTAWSTNSLQSTLRAELYRLRLELNRQRDLGHRSKSRHQQTTNLALSRVGPIPLQRVQSELPQRRPDRNQKVRQMGVRLGWLLFHRSKHTGARVSQAKAIRDGRSGGLRLRACHHPRLSDDRRLREKLRRQRCPGVGPSRGAARRSVRASTSACPG